MSSEPPTDQAGGPIRSVQGDIYEGLAIYDRRFLEDGGAGIECKNPVEVRR